MVLDRYTREILEPQPLDRLVIQVDVCDLHPALVDRVFINGKSVILGGDLYQTGFEVLHRLVGAPVTDKHLAGRDAFRESHQLMPQADAEEWASGGFRILDSGQRIGSGGFRISGSVAEEVAIGLPLPDLLKVGVSWKDPEGAAAVHELVDDALFDAVVKNSDPVLPVRGDGLRLFAGHFGCQLQALHLLPVTSHGDEFIRVIDL